MIYKHNIWLITCIGVTTDLPLLPHFLEHYMALGIDPSRIVVILNAPSEDHPELVAARDLLEAKGVNNIVPWIAPYTSETMWAQRRDAQERFCARSDVWVLSADVDEFHEYPEPLDAILSRADDLHVTCIQGVFIDRLAENGCLKDVSPTPELLDQFPIMAEVALAIGGRSAAHGRGGTVKIMAMRGHIRPGRGGHRPLPDPSLRYLYNYALGDFLQIEDPYFRFGVPTRVHHIHWTKSLVRRLETRLATAGVSPAGVEYGTRQLDHIRKHNGIDLGSIAINHTIVPQDWPRTLDRIRKIGRRYSLIGSVKAAARRMIGR